MPRPSRRSRFWKAWKAASTDTGTVTEYSTRGSMGPPPKRMTGLCPDLSRKTRKSASAAGSLCTFEVKQLALDFNPATVSAQRTVRRDHAMARHNDRNRVAVVRHADRAIGVRMANGLGQIAVAARLAVWDVAKLAPAFQLKLGAPQIERNGKLPALTREVFVELLKVGSQQLSRFLELNFVGIDFQQVSLKFQAHQPLQGSSEEERTHRRRGTNREKSFHDDYEG